MDRLTIRSEHNVNSLVTIRAFKKGEVICPVPRQNVMPHPNRYTVQIGRDLHTQVGELAALNHSCDPNVIIETEQMLLIARRAIKTGDELFYFYPSTEWEMHSPFICGCGAAGCIRVVAGARFLPCSTLEQHYLTPHIQELMIERLNGTKLHLTRVQEDSHVLL